MSMKMTKTEIAGDIGILKFNDFKAVSTTIKSADVSAGEDGKKIVKAGTPVPASAPVGFLLHSVDVTDGDEVVAAVYAGTIDNAKLTKLGVTIPSDVKAKFPRVTFM